MQHSLVVGELHGVLGEFGDVVHVGDERYLLAAIGEQFGHRDAGKIPFAVENHDPLAGHLLAAHDLLGRQYAAARSIGAVNRSVHFRSEPYGRPMRTRGNHHPVRSVFEDLIGGHGADAQLHLDIAQLRQLGLAVTDDATEFGAARIARDIAPVPAELWRAVPQMDRVAALAEDHGALHSGRARSHNEHRARVGGLVELFGMPATTIFLA